MPIPTSDADRKTALEKESRGEPKKKKPPEPERVPEDHGEGLKGKSGNRKER